MSYIAPNTTIYILKGVPLDRRYENTVYYADASTQLTAFLKYQKYALSEYSYQRVNLGTIRVQLKYENLYDCNYLIFKNTNFENKYFYAFITGIAYINNEVTEIYYEIDVLQTWCYDYEFLSSFVSRRHSKNDVWYENTQPEGLELGQKYIAIGNTGFKYTDTLHDFYAVQSTASASDLGLTLSVADTTADIYYDLPTSAQTGIYNGLYFYSGNRSAIQQVITAHQSKGLQDAIVAFYKSPCKIQYHYEGFYTFKVGSMSGDVSGDYTPRNNKLYTSPYHKITITNLMGMSHDYAFENSTDRDGEGAKFHFGYQDSAYPQPCAAVIPSQYRGGTAGEDEGVTYNSFPTCAFIGDTYKAWWAQNKSNYLASLNAIGTQYDTNVQLAQNTYDISARSARSASAQSRNAANTQLANAIATNNTALTNASNNFNVASGQNIANTTSGLIGSALSLDVGGVINAGVQGISNQVGINNTYANAQNTINTNTAIAQANANTANVNNQLALSTALKNAVTSQSSAQLSALSTRNIAISQLTAKKQDIQNVPDTAKGNATAEGVQYATDRAGIYIIEMRIKNEYLKICDDYFTRYGYAQNAVFSSNDLNERINRPHYTYTKTTGALIKGEMNAADLETIEGIYDNGITTWDTLEDVGNYDLDNTPTSTAE